MTDICIINLKVHHSATIDEFVGNISDLWQKSNLFESLQFRICWVLDYSFTLSGSILAITYLYSTNVNDNRLHLLLSIFIII